MTRRPKGQMLRSGAVALAMLAGVAAPAEGQGRRHVVLVQGASGGGEYAELHRRWLDTAVALLGDRLKVEPAQISVLAERPRDGEEPATAEAVRATLARLSGTLAEDDLLFLMLIGHGSGNAEDAKFNLVGPDLTVAEWRALLDPVAGRLVVVDTTSGSFPFLAGLAAPGRVVITATSSPSQRYHTVFPGAFLEALSADAADADQNGRVSMLEAFVYASRLVDLEYEQTGEMQTEHALLDDSGDGEGRLAVVEEGAEVADGAVAGSTYLAEPEVPTSSDPEVQKLLVRRQELNDEIDALRRRQATMAAEEYDRELERLLTELAIVSAEIRRRGGGS